MMPPTHVRALIPCLAVLLTGVACSHGGNGQANAESDIWDIDKDGIPQFVDTNYLELDKIARITRFRSGEGHDYSDSAEHCHSMKHYFEPKVAVDWSAVAVFAPVSGTITRLDEEWAGTKIEIQSDSHPAFRFDIFHVTLSSPLQIAGHVSAGQTLGHHIGSQTYSDIAVIVNDPTHQGRMVSYFDVMTDALFQTFVARGVHARSDVIISKAERDADPLSCNGDAFVSSGTIENWFVLQ